MQAGGFCGRPPDLKVKGNTRHVLIKDLAVVAKALKTKLPLLPSPCGLFSVFDGNPMAAEHCAKNLHSRLLAGLARIDGRISDLAIRRALRGSFVGLDMEVLERSPGQEGCSGAAVLVYGRQAFLVAVGSCSAMSCATNSESKFSSTVYKARVADCIGQAQDALPKLGATGPKVLVSQLSGKVRGAATSPGVSGVAGKLSVDDVKAIQLEEGGCDCLVLVSSLVGQGVRASEVAGAVSAAADLGSLSDPERVARAVVLLAQSRHVAASKDKATWVQSERRGHAEVTCAAILLCWASDDDVLGEPDHKKVKLEPQVVYAASAQPSPACGPGAAYGMQPTVEKQERGPLLHPEPSAAEAAARAAESARYARGEQLRQARKLGDGRSSVVGRKVVTAAAGPATADGQAAEKVTVLKEGVNFAELDSTAQGRMRAYGTMHMRGGPQDRGADEDKGKGRGKGKGKGKSKGKGSKKGKRKPRQGDDELADDEVDGQEVTECEHIGIDDGGDHEAD